MYTCQSEHRAETGKLEGGARHGITNYFVNTMITALQTPEWDTLLKRLVVLYSKSTRFYVKFISRVGDAVILHLLAETSIFVSLPNDCLCQITGPPLLYLPRPQDTLLPKCDRNECMSRVTDGNALEQINSKQSSNIQCPIAANSALKMNTEGSDAGIRPCKRPKTASSTENLVAPPTDGIVRETLAASTNPR